MKIKLLTPEYNRIYSELKKIGVHEKALNMYKKGLPCNIKLSNLTCGQANILKQEAIASGVDAAISWKASDCRQKYTDALILGHYHGVHILIERLKRQVMGLDNIGKQIEDFLENKAHFLQLYDNQLTFEKPMFMGILNITPDSFSDGNMYMEKDNQKKRIDEYKEAGVNFIDIGGQSTRPGANFIEPDIELERIKYAVEYAIKCGITVSVDTFYAKVAEEVLNLGASIINDISGLRFDPLLASTIANHKAAVCIMHMKGIPKTMQVAPHYDNILDDVFNYLDDSINIALKAGIHKNSIIIDPGFGFGKTLDHNMILLEYLEEFKSFKKPILVGLSRKSMIGELTGKQVKERVVGSKILETVAILKGADIIRAHDIDETKQLLNIMESVLKAKNNVRDN